ncbi:MAG: UTP-glucose-phosphate uridylyltransferase, UTP--glucose-phosphate uridylyltransferase [Candidatus Saccharibacteria bacterium]|nr:UTP-glucose-phosphate uridylyltransferase, UTP--glucose-phosphate uridylyltransferase [Candidatus Saccharibacteria bacterium]
MGKKVTKAVIAAAGLGTRFLPMTKAMPKEMLPIIDKPIIQYVVEEAVAAGVTDIIIVGSANKRTIEDHFDHQVELEQKLRKDGKGELADRMEQVAELANFIYLRQKGPYGNATPVLNAAHLLDDEPFLVLFADDFFRSKVPRSVQLVETYEKHQMPTIALIPVERSRAKSYGIADIKTVLDEKSLELSGLIEKPDFASTAGYVFTPEMMRYVEKLEPDKSGELVLANAMNQFAKDHGGQLFGRIIDGQWHDAGNKEKYLEAIVDVALSDEVIAPAFRKYLEDKLAEH